jgi:hypothetical protein
VCWSSYSEIKRGREKDEAKKTGEKERGMRTEVKGMKNTSVFMPDISFDFKSM